MYAPITAIYLDVDEVLVDWVGAALRVLGFDPDDVYARWAELDPRPWNLFDVIGREPVDMWRVIDREGPAFWAELDEYPWAQELLDLCHSTAETTLLTAPSWNPSSYAGKRQWMAKRFGEDFDGYALTRAKYRFSHPGAVLIDDSPRNCECFADPRRGGRAIVFPGHGNDRYYIPPAERVAYVREALAALQGSER